MTTTAIVYRIGSRRKDKLTAWIGEAFLGWLVTDGYGAYLDYPRRQRCLADLIRKALALAEGYDGAGSGLRSRSGPRPPPPHRAGPRWSRRERPRAVDDTHQMELSVQPHEIEKKVRDLAGEILNHSGARHRLRLGPEPATDKQRRRAGATPCRDRAAHQALGTRTDEGSRFYAAGLYVIDTCRRRGVDPGWMLCSLIAAARANLTLPMISATPAPNGEGDVNGYEGGYLEGKPGKEVGWLLATSFPNSVSSCDRFLSTCFRTALAINPFVFIGGSSFCLFCLGLALRR